MNGNRRNKGFTLAELLVVVAIIAVLVAVALPTFAKHLEKSREATDAANIRSQYAEVMTDGITSGGSVNANHEKYAAVELKQTQNGWQLTELANSLNSLFGPDRIVGNGPNRGGIAWVEYDAQRECALLHYEGGSSTGGNTGGNTGGSGGESGTGSDTVIGKVEQSAGTWPTEENLGSIKTGKAYKLPDGTIFIAASDQSYNKYYPPHLPTESGYEWLGVKLSGTIISSDKITDGKLTVTVNYGDILENPDGSLSIWKNSASNTWGVPISDGNWIKLVLA